MTNFFKTTPALALALCFFLCAPDTYAQERTRTSPDSSSRSTSKTTTRSMDRNDRNASIDRRERIRRIRENRNRYGGSSSSRGGRGTNVITEEDRSRGGRGTNVVTEDEREQARERKIADLLKRVSALEERVKKLESSRN